MAGRDDEFDSTMAHNPPMISEHMIQIGSLHETLIQPSSSSRRRRFLDLLNSSPSTEWFKNLRFSSPLCILRRALIQREETSLSVPSPAGVPRRRLLRVHFLRNTNWRSLVAICKEWIKNPMNIALVIWLACVAVSATMLGLLLLGLLNHAFPSKSLRNHWIEINNQVLNALFTLMSIYQHPLLFHQLFMLCRWRSDDVTELRKTYCKGGTRRPNEWAHIAVVVLLLHLTCFAQYTLCSLYWAYARRQRPEFLEDFFFGLGLAAPVIAALYMVYSPLGREYDSDSVSDEELPPGKKQGLKLSQKRAAESSPDWVGGVLNCGEDPAGFGLSFFCTCCVFGWNMERLGFGNMYVHIVTFILLCLAPFWIFNISALNIHDLVIGDVVGVAGIVLCAFGLLYGGYWRIQMRKRFKLPGDTRCLGSASLTDYVKWMFCWSCALAQEVRTGNFYEVEDDSLYRKPTVERDEENARTCDGEAEEVVILAEAQDAGDECGVTAVTAPPIPPSMQMKDVVGEQDSSQLSPLVREEA